MANIIGTEQNDFLVNNAGEADFIDGLGGSDRISAGGNDTVEGGNGNDTITVGGLDANVINAGDGEDLIQLSGTGDDIISAGNGNDIVEIRSVFGATVVTGDKTIDGDAGNDTLNGASGNDTIDGGTGNDFIGGLLGDDELIGGEQDDIIKESSGNNTLIGVNPDSANPGLGEIDFLTGGRDADLYVLGDENGAFYDDGDATTDGQDNFALIRTLQGDRIQLAGEASDYVLNPFSGRVVNDVQVSFENVVSVFNGTGIYLDDGDGVFSSNDELIGVVAVSTPVIFEGADSNVDFV